MAFHLNKKFYKIIVKFFQETDRLLGQQYTDSDSGYYNKVNSVLDAFK